MEINSKIVRWVEYCMCEAAMDIYDKLRRNEKIYSTTFHSFLGRIKESIERDNLSKRDERVLRYMMFRAKREYRVPTKELSEICANFFIDEKWDKYIRAIELMNKVNYQL